MISIPNKDNPILRQSNRAKRRGNIVESFNLDLRSNTTAIRGTRSKVSVSENTVSGLDFVPVGIPGIHSYNNSIVIMTGKASSRVQVGGNSAWDSFSDISSGFTTSGNYGDFAIHNGQLWATSASDLHYTIDNDSFTSASASLSSTSPHLLAVLGNRLYVTNNLDQVDTVSGTTYSATGTGTLDLGIDGYVITMLSTGNDRVWVGASPTGNNATAQISWVFEWDGESENSPIRKYRIDSPGILAGTIWNDIPYVLDIQGRLLEFRGNGFYEVARFPIEKKRTFWGLGSSLNDGRAVHPRGMAVVDDEILINVANRLETSSSDPEFANFPAGVWAYNQENGLYHKYSSSYVLTSTTSVSDYGQYNIEMAGPIYPFRPNNPDTTEGGSVLWSAKIFEDSDNADEDGIWALFVDDTLDTTEKWSYFITSEIHASNIADTWQKIYAKYKKFLNSADKVVVKYKTEATNVNDYDLTWSSTSTLTTATDVSSYVKGDELQIIQGTGSGKSAHITDISLVGSTYVITLDDTFTGVSGTCVGRFDKWIKCGEATYADGAKWKELPIPKDNVSPMIQFKVCMQFTGENELYGLHVVNKPIINE